MNEQQLLARNAELEQQNQALQMEIITRSMPAVPGLTDAINHLGRNAAMGNQAARQVLRGLLDALENARAATSGITVVKNGH